MSQKLDELDHVQTPAPFDVMTSSLKPQVSGLEARRPQISAQSMTTLPDWPDRMTSNASANCV